MKKRLEIFPKNILVGVYYCIVELCQLQYDCWTTKPCWKNDFCDLLTGSTLEAVCWTLTDFLKYITMQYILYGRHGFCTMMTIPAFWQEVLQQHSYQQRRLVYGLKALEEDRSLKVKTAFSRLLEGVPKQVTNNILRAILGDKMSCHVRPK